MDPAKADDALTAIILKGVDDAMPKMPAFGAKSMTEDQAKSLVTLMKSLRQ